MTNRIKEMFGSKKGQMRLGFDIQGYAILGVIVGVISYLAGQLLNIVGQFNVEFATVSVREQRGVFTAVGEQLVNFGPFATEGFALMGLVVSIIAGIAVVLVGRFLLGFIPLDKILGARTPTKKIASVLVLGVLALTLVLMNAGLPGLNTAIALVIWAVIVAFITVQLAGIKGIPISIPQN